MLDLLEPGLHTGISSETYHECAEKEPLASAHILANFLQSGAHCIAGIKSQRSGDKKATPAMVLGTALHASGLEPRTFADTYAIKTQNWSTTEGKKEKAALLAKYKPENILTAEQFKQCQEMSKALHKHSLAATLLKNSKKEITGVWDDPAGCRCKMRVDMWCPEMQTIADLKTTEDASERAFKKTIYNHGTYLQIGMYMRGMEILGENPEHFAIIAVEKNPPYGVVFYDAEPELIETGLAVVDKYLPKFARCVATKTWPGYPSGVVSLGMPGWAFNEIQTLLEDEKDE